MRNARGRAGLSQSALAARAGTTQTQICRIERNLISPSLATLDKILGAMGETIALSTLILKEPPPGGGNTPVRELRAGYELMSAEERLEQAAELSRIQTELAAAEPNR